MRAYAYALAACLILSAGLAKSDGEVIEKFSGPHYLCVQIAKVRANAEGADFVVWPGEAGTAIRIFTDDPRGDVIIWCGRDWRGVARWEKRVK